MSRILFAVLLLIIASLGSAQNTLTPTGAMCDGSYFAYISPTDPDHFLCLSESPDDTATNPTDCQAACSVNYPFSVYGYLRGSSYYPCMCLNYGGSPVSTDTDFKYFLGYTQQQTLSSEVRDLASSVTFDFQVDLNSNNETQLTIALNQTAVLRTSALVNGNGLTFIAKPSVAGVTAPSTFGFTVTDLTDWASTSTQTALFRNNSFQISNFVQAFNPSQSSTDQFVFTMKNIGTSLFVVLSSGNTPITSWYYRPVASYVDNSIVADDFTFNLDLEFTATMQYASCGSTQCAFNNTLEVCVNNQLVDRISCPIGCDSSTSDCIRCNSTNCQGTCSSDLTTCECSDSQLGSSCQVDITTSSFHVMGGGSKQEMAGVDYQVPAVFDLVECSVDDICGTVSYIVPDMNFMGISVTGSCCTATLRLAEIQRDAADTRTLQFVKESDWACKQGDLIQLKTDAMATDYPLTVQAQSNGPYGPYGPNNGQSYTNYQWSWNGEQLNSNGDGSSGFGKCDASLAGEVSANKQIIEAVVPVSVTFMVVSCVAVAGGFVGGFFLTPRGLTVKKKHFKGCLPKGNAALSRSIIAIVCVDVGVVTTMGLVGALYPISAMVIVSGILLAVMVFQYEAAASRFKNNKNARMYHMQKVERVFGRLGAAFLIIIGIVLILTEVVKLLPSFLSILTSIFAGILGYIYLALFITWVFVVVHFAAAIYLSVVWYYTAARTDEQESIEEHSSTEMSEKQTKAEP